MAEQRIAGRYRLEGRLGIGGMSTVQRAFDTRLERLVAVKLLAEHLAEDETFVSRFRREALAAARLVHPNIVQVFDFGLDESTDQHFIVMELVAGQSCAEILRARGALPVNEALDIVAQACRGLDHAHRNGVVHRDVKPGNLLRSDDGVVKLADFGIAKATEQSSITQVGSVLGTAAYLAPEQARGEEAGPPADLYALGVVTYQLLSGRLPYEAASLSELALKQQREVPDPLDAANPDVGPELARAVARALSLSTAARYATATEMADALRAGARGIAPALPDVPDEATAATQMLQTGGHDATAATRLAPASPPTPTHRQPAVPPVLERSATRRGDRATSSQSRRRPRHSLGRRLFRALMVLVILAGLIAAGSIIAADQLSGEPRLLQDVDTNAQRAIDQLEQLIDDNVR